MSEGWRRLWLWFWRTRAAQGGVLAMVVGVVFLQSARFDFVNHDDPQYVYANPRVRTGLSLGNIRWALTSLHGDVSYWHPVTWLSHQLDCELFGLRPGPHHLTNVWIHTGSTLVLLAVLRRLGSGVRASFFVAGLFAVHPLHVESVAWVAERKNVLCGQFWLLTVYWYARFRQSGWRRDYLLALGCYLLALGSKPAAVALVPILIFFEGLGLFDRADDGLGSQGLGGPRRPAPWGMWFKWFPFALLAISSGIVTVIGQARVGALPTLTALPLSERLDNAIVTCALYLKKAILPLDLSVSYVRSEPYSGWALLFSASVLVLISGWAWASRRTERRLFGGWCWYALALLPTVGLVQAGAQSMADRYMYMPFVGLGLVLAETMKRATRVIRLPWISAGGFAVLGLCAVLSFQQAGVWRNSTALFSRAAALDSNNWVARLGLGMALTEQGRFEEALVHLRCAARLPGNAVETRKRLEIWAQWKEKLEPGTVRRQDGGD